MNLSMGKVIFCYMPFFFLLAVFSAAAESTETDPLSILFPHQWIGNIDRAGLNEPSGITFHATRGTLFAVGDNGDICEIQTDGALIKQKHVMDADFEGITCDPSTGLLYIAVEGKEKILEIDPDNFRTKREFAIERRFQGKMVLKPGGQGIESIAFVPDPDHPEGGTFYLTNQAFDSSDPEELSAILHVEVPLKSGASGKLKARITEHFPLDLIDLSGSYYDSVNDRLYFVSDATNTFSEITRTGEITKIYAFPGRDQEGIALDEEGFLYIAQDSGGILKIKWNK